MKPRQTLDKRVFQDLHTEEEMPMFTSKSKTDKAKDALDSGLGKAQDRAQAAADRADKVAAQAKAQAKDASGTAQDRAQAAADRAAELSDTAREKAHEFADYAAPRVEHAKETIVDDVIPKVAEALATVAAGALAAKGMAKEAAHNAPDAYSVLKGEKKAKKSKGKWLLALGALAAGAAYVAYKKSAAKPDPWATATPYSPSTTNSAGGSVTNLAEAAKEKASAAAAAVSEKAAEVKDAAADKVEELKDKGADAAAKADDSFDDAKGELSEAADSAGDALDELKDGAQDAAHDAKDETGDAWSKAQDWADDKKN